MSNPQMPAKPLRLMSKNTCFLVFLSLLLWQCHEANQATPKGVEEPAYNACFAMEYGYSDVTLADTIRKETPAGNFLKKRSLNASQYVWSCGRGSIEYIIDTFDCSYAAPDWFDWETEEFMAFIRKCGSNCWTNIIFPVQEQGKPQTLQYAFIERQTLRTLSIHESQFEVTDLATRQSQYYPIDGVECIDGYPPFFIKAAKLVGDSITYQVKCEDGTLVPYAVALKI